MSKIYKPLIFSNYPEMPLFLWASRQTALPLPIIGRRLCRAGFAPATARAISELVGLKGGAV